MSGLSSTTGNINITHPEQWTLNLGIGDTALEYVLFSKKQVDSLISGVIDLDLTQDSYLKAVENAVYDNPVLLDDYHQVNLLIHSQHFVILPQEVDDEDDAEELLEATFGEVQGDVALCELRHCKASIAFEISGGLLSFVQRTFNCPRIYHHLHPLCEYFARVSHDSGVRRMYLNMQPDTMDVVILDNGALHMANTFDYRAATDAAFYAMHAWQTFGLDAQTDEIQLTGNKEAREAVMPQLRQFVNYVMPAIFPAAALKIGHDAVKAPFSLILLALCV